MRKWRIIIYLILIALACSIAFSTFPDFQPSEKRIERLMNVPIPADASDLQAHFQSWQGSSFYAQFSLPPNSLQNFIATLCSGESNPLSTDYNAYASLRLPTWPDCWLPDATQISVSGCCFPSPGVDVEIFVDDTDPKLYRIYMRGGTA